MRAHENSPHGLKAWKWIACLSRCEKDVQRVILHAGRKSSTCHPVGVVLLYLSFFSAASCWRSC